MLVDRVLPMTRTRLVTVGYDAPMLKAAQLLGGSLDLVVVCGPDGLLKGVITKTDIVRQIGQCHGSSCETAISSVMTRDVAICRPADWLHDVWSIMKERRLKNIPVADADPSPTRSLDRSECSTREMH